MIRRNQKKDACSKGIAMVEFVIVLPICLTLVVATAEFGRAFMQYNTLTQSVRDGIRFLAAKASPGQTGVINITGTVQVQTRNLVVYGNTSGSGSVILPGLTAGAVTVSDAGGGNVSIAVAYPYTSIFSSIPGFSYGANTVLNGINLQAAATMRAM